MDRAPSISREPAAVRTTPAARHGPWRPSPFLRSAALRFAAIYALLFGVSAVALAVFVWFATGGVLDRETDAAITADVQALSERWQAGGLPALIITIENRLAEDVDDNAIYLVVDPAMHRVVGNLSAWPNNLPLAQTWAELPITRAGVRSVARVRRFNLPNGFHLLVGRDVEARTRLRSLLAGALVWALGGMIVLGLGGAIVVRGLFRRALANVSATTAAISAGDLTKRVHLSGRGDEFDHLSETINEMLERISRLMDGVRQVSNAIAHDLRTPITRARARLEDAALHAASEADLRAALERAIADLDGIAAIFQALLRIAEIEAGARRSAFAPFDAAPLLADLVDLYGPLAEERGVALTLSVPAALPLFGDRDLIQQAVANLLDNALKFSPKGSSVALLAEVAKDATNLVVADHGPGIPVADRARATERFFRSDAARNTPGAGLGLALVQAVAQLHAGSLELADNAPGIRATLRLPPSPERPETASAPEAA